MQQQQAQRLQHSSSTPATTAYTSTIALLLQHLTPSSVELHNCMPCHRIKMCQ
jgi:hypothetical protein